MRSRRAPEGWRRPAVGHGQSGGVQGVQPLRRGLPRRRAGHGPAGRRRRWRSCGATGRCGSGFPTPTIGSSTSRDVDEGIGVLSSLLLKKGTYRSMVGGDGACMGCGEKTAVHLIVSAIYAAMQPRVQAPGGAARRADRRARRQARELLSAGADLDAATAQRAGRWRCRSTAGHAGAAAAAEPDARTSCAISSGGTRRVRAARAGRRSAWPTAPAARRSGAAPIRTIRTPSLGQSPLPGRAVDRDRPVRSADAEDGRQRSRPIRRAEMLRDGALRRRRARAGARRAHLDRFTDDEFALCPPIVAMGGDGAMLDIGFQNLSRLLASGKPIRVVVLDTQVYSNTGGQACTSGFTGQVADMSAYGKAQHGKTEVRKEVSLIAHRAPRRVRPSVVAGVGVAPARRACCKGLHKRRPVLINVYTPCPVEHGLADDWSQHAARLALESRAFPFLTFDPDAGRHVRRRALAATGIRRSTTPWPTYTLRYLDDDGAEQRSRLPLTIADWAATEGAFQAALHRAAAGRVGRRAGAVPRVRRAGADGARRAGRRTSMACGRTGRWAGCGVGRDRAPGRGAAAVLVATASTGGARDRPVGAGRGGGHVARAAEFAASASTARRIRREAGASCRAELSGADCAAARRGTAAPGRRVGGGGRAAGVDCRRCAAPRGGVGRATARCRAAPAAADATAAQPAASGITRTAPRRPRRLLRRRLPLRSPMTTAMRSSLEAYIESARCTTCNECTNLNKKMFAYNADKQAYVKDAAAGTFQQLVLAAERCPVSIIHPGTPLNPEEKDLEVGQPRRRSSTEAAMRFASGFRHGVHPPEEKELTQPAPDPPDAVSRRDRAAAAPARRQPGAGCAWRSAITSSAAIRSALADGFVSVPIHASAAGTVTDIEWWPHPDGSMAMAVRIARRPLRAAGGPAAHGAALGGAYRRSRWSGAVQDAGVVGLGGAAFPTHVKLAPPRDHRGAHADHQRRRVRAVPDIGPPHHGGVSGPGAVRHPRHDAHPGRDALRGGHRAEQAGCDRRDAVPRFRRISTSTILPLTVKYPQGAEKMLIKAVTGVEVPSGKLPVTVGRGGAERRVGGGDRRGLRDRAAADRADRHRLGSRPAPPGESDRAGGHQAARSAGVLRRGDARRGRGGDRRPDDGAGAVQPRRAGAQGDDRASWCSRRTRPGWRRSIPAFTAAAVSRPARSSSTRRCSAISRGSAATTTWSTCTWPTACCAGRAPTSVRRTSRCRNCSRRARSRCAAPRRRRHEPPRCRPTWSSPRRRMCDRRIPRRGSCGPWSATLVPVVAAAAWFFGISALLVIAACDARRGGRPSGRSGAAARSPTARRPITGVLLGLSLPAGLPLWMAALGGAFGIGFGKVVWGGLGQNVFNPALLGRAFLQAAFPVAITTWPAVGGGFWALRGDLFALPFLHPADRRDHLGDAAGAAQVRGEGNQPGAPDHRQHRRIDWARRRRW